MYELAQPVSFGKITKHYLSATNESFVEKTRSQRTLKVASMLAGWKKGEKTRESTPSYSPQSSASNHMYSAEIFREFVVLSIVKGK